MHPSASVFDPHPVIIRSPGDVATEPGDRVVTALDDAAALDAVKTLDEGSVPVHMLTLQAT